MEEGPLGGPVLENLVIAEILKAAAHRGLDVEAHYFRESNGLESDLLIRDRERGRHWIVDVKSSHTAKAPWIESLGRVAALVEKPGSRAGSRRVVIYRGPTKRDWPTPGCDFSVSKTRLPNGRRRHGRCTIIIHLPRSVSQQE